MVFALLGAEGNFGVKESADSLLPDLLTPIARLPVAMEWIGLPLSFALALAMVPAGIRGLADAGLRRDNYRGLSIAFPLGAMLATTALVALAPLAFLNDRADLDLLDPELRRWIPYVLGVAFLGFLDDSLGQGGPGDHAARLARPCPRDRARAGSRPVRSRRSAPWRSPPTWSRAAASSPSSTWPTSPC